MSHKNEGSPSAANGAAPDHVADRTADHAHRNRKPARETEALAKPTHANARKPTSKAPAIPEDFRGKIFIALDRNRDGQLAADEIPEAFRAELLTHDANHDKQVSFAEFEAALPQMAAHRPAESNKPSVLLTRPEQGPIPVYVPRTGKEARLPAWFRERDKDGDSQVSLREWPPSQIELFRTLDQNGDGFITASEASGTPRTDRNPPPTP